MDYKLGVAGGDKADISTGPFPGSYKILLNNGAWSSCSLPRNKTKKTTIHGYHVDGYNPTLS